MPHMKERRDSEEHISVLLRISGPMDCMQQRVQNQGNLEKKEEATMLSTMDGRCRIDGEI